MDLPKKVNINEVKLLNPKLSRKDRQKKMSLWLMPFGFIAGLTFSGKTNLQTFSGFGLSHSTETFIGKLETPTADLVAFELKYSSNLSVKPFNTLGCSV